MLEGVLSVLRLFLLPLPLHRVCGLQHVQLLCAALLFHPGLPGCHQPAPKPQKRVCYRNSAKDSAQCWCFLCFSDCFIFSYVHPLFCVLLVQINSMFLKLDITWPPMATNYMVGSPPSPTDTVFLVVLIPAVCLYCRLCFQR